MKSLLLILSICTLISADQKSDIIQRYFDAYNKVDVNQLQVLLDDSFKVYYENKVLVNKQQFLEGVKSFSYFKPKFTILKSEKREGKIYAEIEETNIILDNLCIGKISFNDIFEVKNRKILSLTYGEVLVPKFDSTYKAKRTLFKNWVQKNHPEKTVNYYEITPATELEANETIELLKKYNSMALNNCK